MNNDPMTKAEAYVDADTRRHVLNFAYEQGLIVTHYNPINDWWHLSDGEIYTTRAILREVGAC